MQKHRLAGTFVGFLAFMAVVLGAANPAAAGANPKPSAQPTASASGINSSSKAETTQVERKRSFPFGTCTAYAEPVAFSDDEFVLRNITNVQCTPPIGWELVRIHRTLKYDDGGTQFSPVITAPVRGRMYTAVAKTECSAFEVVGIPPTTKHGHMSVSAVYWLPNGTCVTDYVSVSFRGIC